MLAGGYATSVDGVVGRIQNGNGAFLVSGRGSTWINNGELRVGPSPSCRCRWWNAAWTWRTPPTWPRCARNPWRWATCSSRWSKSVAPAIRSRW
ncbi:hypothetical protein DAI43_29870 [Achromobacter xylosoxidans]|nr:hypothetical protein DAI43_29870 [Achromobacter xylosoxidans]